MICVPIKRKNFKSFMKDFVSGQKIADLTELWFDQLEDLNSEKIGEIFAAKKKPIIYKYEGNKENLNALLEQNLEYIDLDIKTPQATIQKIKKLKPGSRIIISFHDFEKTPTKSKLNAVINKMLAKNADIVKLATFANSFTDSLEMLSLLVETVESGQKAILICMGENGKITRTSGLLLGNYLMYAPLKLSEKTADGQIEVAELKKLLKEYKCH